MKICIIGNSHIATLKRAWDDELAERYPNFRLTFFGAVQIKLLGLQIENGVLTPNNQSLADNLKFTSGGQSTINPADFDEILIVGLCRDVNTLVENFETGYSSAVIEQAIIDYWDKSNLAKLLTRVAKIHSGRIFAGHNPLRSIGVDAPIGTGQYPRFVDLSNQLGLAKFKTELIPQPGETLIDGKSTAQKFCSQSVRLSVGVPRDSHVHSDVELAHMNAAFGAIWLEHFFGRLTEREKTQP